MKKEIIYDNCPSCNNILNKKDILEYFTEVRDDPNNEQHNYYKDYTDEQLLEVAANYGYTKEKPEYFNNDIIGIEYSHVYDGILVYQCKHCKNHWGRFSGIVNVNPHEERNFMLKSEL